MSNLSPGQKWTLFGVHVLLYPVAAVMAFFGIGMCLCIGWECSGCSDAESQVAGILISVAMILAFANFGWSVYWFVVALKWTVNRLLFRD